MDVLDALDATAHLADETAATRVPDDTLVGLGQVPGVERGSIEIPTVDPRPARHGAYVVRWRQDGRTLSREGHTLDIALRRALRAASAVSAKAETE